MTINLSLTDAFSYADLITHLGEYGLDFDGTDDLISVAHSTSLNILSGKATIDMWFKRSDTTAATMVLIDKNSATPEPIYVNIDPTHAIYIQMYYNSSNYWFAYSTTLVNNTNWHHLVVIFDYDDWSNSLIYLDGAVETLAGATQKGTEKTMTNTGPLSMGATNSGTNLFNGIIDEVRIYNRALSADEIREHASKKKLPPDDAVAVWHMDENGGSGDLVVDETLNRNDGRRKPTYPTNVPNYVWTGDRPMLLSIKPDAFSLADIFSSLKSRRLALTDAFRLADILSTLKSRRLALTDALTLADAVTVLRARLVVLLDAYSHGEVFSTQEAYYRILTDAYSHFDLLSTREEYYRSLTDAFAHADPITALRTRLLGLVDAHSFADALATQETYHRILLDAYSLADAVSTQETYYRTLTDALTLADIASTQETYYRTLTDAHALADMFSTLRARRLEVVDPYALADATSTQEAYYRTLTDAYSLADILSTLRSRRMTLADTFTLADTLSKSEAYYRALADAYRHADLLQTRETYYRALTDAYALADRALARRNPVLLAKLIAKLIQLVDLEGGI